jgi:tRNA uridine 5-carbamoylmethylation protein Kti12
MKVNLIRLKREALHKPNSFVTDAAPLPRLDNLLMRYEEPSSMVRWDSPLLTVPWDEEGIPSEEIWQAVTTGDLKPANVGTRAVSIRRHIRTNFRGD